MTVVGMLPGLALVILLIAVTGGLIRALRGPTQADRMLAIQLLGSGGVAALLMMAHISLIEALVDVALVLALLAAVAVAALTGKGEAA